MGVLPGTEVRIVRLAPLGDPIEIEVRGFHLSLRKTEAAEILVESDDSTD
jgi:Fe2+ transport system protein FeoA